VRKRRPCLIKPRGVDTNGGAVERAVLGEDTDTAAGVAGEHIACASGMVALEVDDAGGIGPWTRRR
jgi:hypothetical protein